MKHRLFIFIISFLSVSFAMNAQDASLYMKYAQKGDKEAMYNLATCYLNGSGGVSQDYSIAFRWFEKSAKKNYGPAQFMTAYCCLYGIGTEQNWKTAWKIADKAVSEGFRQAYWIKAQLFKLGYMVDPNMFYVKYLTSAATSGYSVAQAELGVLYLYGSDEAKVEQNMYNAVKWLKMAAENNDDDGLYYLGLCYENGLGGLPKDQEKAWECYEKAADLGDSGAQAVVGYAYLVGTHVNADYSKAYEYLKASAQQDNAYAYGKLGDMYYYGLGVEENNNTAMDMYKYAVKLNDSYSMTQLAYMYLNGIGAGKDDNLAYNYYKQAAELGNAQGEYGLGYCYEAGIWVRKDEKTAFSWYKKAADQNYAAALFKIAECYLNGSGTTKDVSKYIENLKKSAELEYVSAMETLAYEYYSGEHLITGPKTDLSLQWFKKAADANSVYSQCALGYFYYSGQEQVTQKDYKLAYHYLNAAVQNDNFQYMDDDAKADVYHYLAGCYRYGRGTDADQSLASYYTEQSAKYGNEKSKRATGLIRRNEGSREVPSAEPQYSQSTHSVSVNSTANASASCSSEATSTSEYVVMKKPAQNGNWAKYATQEAINLFNQGMKEEENGNYSKAFDYYLSSLKGGFYMAANSLAYLYAYGRGVKKDINLARYYIDYALQNFKDKNLVYPGGDYDFWYKEVLDSKGEICVCDNDWEEAYNIFCILVEFEDDGMGETTFIKAMQDKLYIGPADANTSPQRPYTISIPSNRIETQYHHWELLCIEIRDDCTYLHNSVTPLISNSYVLNDGSEYIEDSETGKRYYILESTLGKLGEKKPLYNHANKPYNFVEVFPALPESVKFINIYSGSKYYIKNFQIK